MYSNLLFFYLTFVSCKSAAFYHKFNSPNLADYCCLSSASMQALNSTKAVANHTFLLLRNNVGIDSQTLLTKSGQTTQLYKWFTVAMSPHLSTWRWSTWAFYCPILTPQGGKLKSQNSKFIWQHPYWIYSSLPHEDVHCSTQLNLSLCSLHQKLNNTLLPKTYDIEKLDILNIITIFRQ